MMVLRFFLDYLLVGQIVSWGSVFFVVASLAWKCRGRDDVFDQINAEHRRANGTTEWCPETYRRLYRLWRFAVTAVLWPRNVVTMLYLHNDQMKLANALMRADAE